jgi:putative ABC transport system permease protein
MWGNYFKVGFRALTKNRTYAFINLVGLAIGLAACLLLLLYVRYELSYDKWLPDAERVYQVQSFSTDPETGEKTASQGVTRPLGAALEKDFPQIEAISKLEGDRLAVLKDGRAVNVEEATAADPNFFRIIQIPFLEGNPRTALQTTDGLTLSRSEALRLFGSTKVLGRTLTVSLTGEKRDYRVTGVFEDLPKNTHMSFSMVRRFNSAEEQDCPWRCVNGTLYVKLRPGTDVAMINNQMQAWEKRNVPARDVAGSDIGSMFDWRLTNVRDVHLGEAQDGERPGNDMRTIVTFTLIALLILGMACVNFVNLATARAGQRAREVAVRKVLGARRSQLVIQFLGESLLLVAVAMVMALAFVELALPVFSDFLVADLRIRYLGPDGLAPAVAGLTLLVGVAGGLYPAFYLSRYQPAAVLKANKSGAEARGHVALRSGLVVAQFAVSIALIICTAVVYHQTLFARTADPGYQREGLLIVSGMTNSDARAKQETLKREIGRIRGIESVSASTIVPASETTFMTAAQLEGRTSPIEIGFYRVDPDFFDTLKIPLVAGRTLSADRPADSVVIDYSDEDAAAAAEKQIAVRGFNVVLNELAARRLGFKNSAEAVGRQIRVPVFGEELGPVAATIVGVVKDTRFRSVREPLEPMIYYDGGDPRWLAIRYRSARPEAVREQVEQVWKRLLPEEPFQGEFSVDRVTELYGAEEARGQAFAGFSLLAVVIACLGLFGLAAFTAERRTKEIGIRKVFGARVRDIVKLLAWQFSKPVVIANLIAWPAAWWVMRDWLNTFDARIDLGPGPFLLAGILALAIAMGTVSGHAVRVARLNPVHALRYE